MSEGARCCDGTMVPPGQGGLDLDGGRIA